MNIEKIFFRKQFAPLKPEQRKTIKVVRIVMFVSLALMMPSFIYTIMIIRNGTPETYPNQYLGGIILPIAMSFQVLSNWFMTKAELFPEKARGSLIIGWISLVIFVMLGLIGLWIMFLQ